MSISIEVNKIHYFNQNNKPVLFCVGRKQNGERIIAMVVGEEPYFYAPKGTVLPNDEDVVRIESDLESSKSWVYGSDERFDKIITRVPSQVAKLRDRLEEKGIETHQSKVLFPYVFRIHKDIYRGIEFDVPDNFDFKNKVVHINKVRGNDKLLWNMKKLYFDIEVDITGMSGMSMSDITQDGKKTYNYICIKCGESYNTEQDAYNCVAEHLNGADEESFKKYIKKEVKSEVNAPIICLTFYDEFNDECYVFQIVKSLKLPKKSFHVNEKQFFKKNVTRRELSEKRDVFYSVYKDEKAMLRDVVRFLTRTDFDFLIGFNNEFFDNPKLINRLEYLKIPYKSISPLNVVNQEVIYGVEILDVRRMMLDLLRKQVKWGGKKSLDHFAEEFLGLNKINLFDRVSEELKDNRRISTDIHGQIYHHGNKEDNILLANYCLEDTLLTYLIDVKKRLTITRILDMNIYGVEYDTSLTTIQGCYIYSLRMAKECGFVLPNTISIEKRGESESFEGAEVFDPYNGVIENVICLDFSRHYTRLWDLFNMGLDTITENGDIKLDNGLSFVSKTKRVSYICKIFDKLDVLREQKISEMKKYMPDTEEYKLLDSEQYRIKQKINEFYGYYKWVDNEIDSCIPYLAKYFIIYAGKFVEDKIKLRIAYGDTDSIYIIVPKNISDDKIKDLGYKLQKLTNTAISLHIKERWGIDTNRIQLKFERFGRFAQYGTKKQYAMYIKWHKDWKEVPKEEDRYVFKGYKNIRSDYSDLIEDLVSNSWKLILNKKPINDVINLIRKVYNDINTNKVSLDYLSTPKKISKPLDMYMGSSANDIRVRGARNSILLGLPITSGDKPKLVMLDKIYENPYGIREDKRLALNGVCFFDVNDVKDFIEKYTSGIDKEYYINDMRKAVEPILSLFNQKWEDILIDGDVITGR